LKKDIINFIFGFVCGSVIFYTMVQTSIIQMGVVIDQAYKLTIEMEQRIQEDKLNKNEDSMKFPKSEKSII
jgi:hypothetical protein